MFTVEGWNSAATLIPSATRATSMYAVVLSVILQAPSLAPIRGFPTAAVATEVRHEQQLRAIPSRDTLRAQMRLLAAEPHEAGTERSHHVAELILARFKSFGLDAKIERFEALMPRPLSRTVELVAPEPFTATPGDPTLSLDPNAGQK